MRWWNHVQLLRTKTVRGFFRAEPRLCVAATSCRRRFTPLRADHDVHHARRSPSIAVVTLMKTVSYASTRSASVFVTLLTTSLSSVGTEKDDPKGITTSNAVETAAASFPFSAVAST